MPRLAVSLAAAVACALGASACTKGEAPAPPPPPADGKAATSTAPPSAQDPDSPSSQDRFRQPDKLIAALALRPGDAVAEVGSGAGYLTVRLARAVGPSGRVVSTDIEPGFLETLASRARAAGVANVTTRLVPPDEPKLEPKSYDVIFLAQVDHLLPDRAAYLRKLLPALKPGGRIAISNRDRWKDGLLGALPGLPLRLEDNPVQLPGQFLVTLHPQPAAGAAP